MVAWISVRSSVGTWVERLSLTDSFTDDICAAFHQCRDPDGLDPGRLIEPFGSYAILSKNSSTALPTRSSFLVSVAVRFGLLTYQASAAIWCLAIQSAAAAA